MVNGILINYTAAAELKIKMVFIGAISKMTKGTAMEHQNFLTETYTLGNTSTKNKTAMESTDTHMATFITGSSDTATRTAMDITSGQLARNTAGSGGMG